MRWWLTSERSSIISFSKWESSSQDEIRFCRKLDFDNEKEERKLLWFLGSFMSKRGTKNLDFEGLIFTTLLELWTLWNDPLIMTLLKIWFGCFVWYMNPCSFLIPNPLYTYILNIYDLVWSGFMAYQPL